MATYKESGVDVELGDRCSKMAYEAAKGTFAGRKGMVGGPVIDDGGFTGMLDMGDFYLVQNDDGVGTKIEVAEKMRKFDTLGYDLIAMVADDAICVGAEVISLTNTLDSPSLDEEMVKGLMSGLKKAALEQKIIIPGGELAELGDALNSAVWNATAVGILNKDKIINGQGIAEGDVIIGLKSDGIRSNGLSLTRHILKGQFGEDWVNADYGDGRSWGEVILTPSKIYHRAILSLIGGFGENAKVHSIKGIVHNTGGGIRGNLPRLLNNFGADLDNLIEAHEFMLKMMEFGNVERDEAYKTWNMGVGMMMVVDSDDVDKVINGLSEQNVEAQVIGKVIIGDEIKF